ncbi:MAG TPA: hypothetical protein PKH79_10400 [Prolixibacteraceae bacterium]|nr:hypothetical protein [Prolixibacteraceae bacterium]HPS11897.1 hypothetical protein [Prolixibacteraceae bacterium]
MAKIEDQRILIWCNEEENLRQTLIDAVYFALKLEKEVCLFAHYKKEKEKKELENRISVYANIIQQDIPQLSVATLLLPGELEDIIGELGEKFNCIMLCFGGNLTTPLLKAFYQSGFPFYFSRGNAQSGNRFKRILIPIDFRNNTKDATLWGSYLGRFNQSEIELLKANDKDPDLKDKVETIVSFVKKFYNQFKFNYWMNNGEKSSWGIHEEAVTKSYAYDLLIFTGSLNVSLADQIVGPFEKRLVKKSTITPVLLINPQKEMYVLCT